MAVFKCKMCGGTLEVQSVESVAVCDSCGSKQTIPNLSDDRRANLYDRANHFRRANDFDKARSIYEQILNEDNTDAEAHWSNVLCKYGIEYVEDPTTHKRVPTVNRAQYTSIFADEDYKEAVNYADDYQREIYEQEAKQIDEIQKRILEISQKEEPFDVFISFKETDANGHRTPDSVLANDLYHQLTQEGFKVFFSPITLEDKLGSEYEPYIFAALNSAKAMVILGTKPEYFNAPWVKNEWSRYLTLIKNGAKKTLIPAYKDMDPYDLPEEFSHLMAQDMSKLGFMQDLIRGIKKIAKVNEEPNADASYGETKEQSTNANISSLLDRGFMALEDCHWDKADEFFERVLDSDSRNARAYLGKLMADLHVSSENSLENCILPFDNNSNYLKVLRFADEKLSNEVKGCVAKIKERNENTRLKDIYGGAMTVMNSAKTEDAYKSAAEIFQTIHDFKDADNLTKECLEKAEICRKDAIYASGKSQMTGNVISSYESAIRDFKSIPGWKDADNQISLCQRKIEELKAKTEAERLEAERKAEEKRIADEMVANKRKKIIKIAAPSICACIALVIVLTKVIIPNIKYNAAVTLMDGGKYAEAITAFEVMNGYKDSEAQIVACQTAIKEIEYNNAVVLMNERKYAEAITAFEEMNGYKDSEAQIVACQTAKKEMEYNNAVVLMNEGKYAEAISAFEVLNGYKDSRQKLKDIRHNPDYYSFANTGDIIILGSYEQDNNTTNGKEEIEWLVLEKEDNRILVISEKALDSQPYDSNHDNKWETCSLRKWLNDSFVNEAFSAEEQNIIQNTIVTADKNPIYNISAGNDTEDKVFLLSIKEASKYLWSDEKRKCVSTAYAKAQGAETSRKHFKDGENTCEWWMRGPGRYSDYAAIVLFGGLPSEIGDYASKVSACVRPALWINLES